MAVLQPDKLKWYHPLNTKTDSNGLLWNVATNPFNFVDIEGFVVGQVGNAIESVVTPPHSILSRPVADYPSLDGSSDVTVAMWLNPPSSGAYDFLCGWMDVTNVRFQQIGIESSGGALSFRNGVDGNPELTFSGLTITRNVWSLVMLNLHHDGSDWEARKSINGAPWSAPVAPTSGSAAARLPFTGTSEFAFIHLVIAAAGGLIDEVAIWDDATLFTNQEISNMYDLGNVLGEGFDQYTNQFTNFNFNISSDPSGVAIAVSPNDDVGSGDGTTPFARNYASSTDVTLTAPATSENRCFAGWRNSVGDTLSLSRSFTLNVSGGEAVTAHYEYAGDSRDDHSVASP